MSSRGRRSAPRDLSQPLGHTPLPRSQAHPARGPSLSSHARRDSTDGDFQRPEPASSTAGCLAPENVEPLLTPPPHIAFFEGKFARSNPSTMESRRKMQGARRCSIGSPEQTFRPKVESPRTEPSRRADSPVEGAFRPAHARLAAAGAPSAASTPGKAERQTGATFPAKLRQLCADI